MDAEVVRSREQLGDRIRMLRKARGFRSMEQLAQASGLTMNTVWRVESGNAKQPSFDTLQKLARGLGVGVGELVE